MPSVILDGVGESAAWATNSEQRTKGKARLYDAFRLRATAVPRQFDVSWFEMLKFLLWCILFVLCWPLALLALLLYPIVWLVLLPFRMLGVAVRGVLDLVWVVIRLPATLLRKL